MSKGGVHKLRIFSSENGKDFFQFFPQKIPTNMFFAIVSGKNKVHMAEYRGAKFCHRCNTVDTSGFSGPGGGFSGNRSSGKPLLLLRVKNHPQDHKNH